MSGRKPATLSRRGLLAGGVLLFGATGVRAAPAESGAAWLDYEMRLRARLIDAGGGDFEPDFAQTLLTHANRLRASEGLESYEWDEDLALCARAHAADMAALNYFAHESPEGFKHPQRAALLMRDLCADTAENLAWRQDQRGSTPRQFEELWEGSPGHRKNLLQPNYRSAGYGVVQVGAAIYAAGVYADASIRLARPLPLQVASGQEIGSVLSGASPNIDRLAMTKPFEKPVWSASPQKIPDLTPGIWQLRPMRAIGAHTFDVLAGPLFVVS